MRWTLSPRKDEARSVRSTKPCGPDTPMLVSSFAGREFSEATVTKNARYAEESTE